MVDVYLSHYMHGSSCYCSHIGCLLAFQTWQRYLRLYLSFYADMSVPYFSIIIMSLKLKCCLGRVDRVCNVPNIRAPSWNLENIKVILLNCRRSYTTQFTISTMQISRPAFLSLTEQPAGDICVCIRSKSEGRHDSYSHVMWPAIPTGCFQNHWLIWHE